MTRILLQGGQVFDGSGADPSSGDVAIEDGRIVDVGTGLDGDQAVDVAGKTILPGFFDCHTHVCISNVNLWERRPGAVLAPVLRGAGEPPQDARDRDHLGPRRRWADLGIRTALERGMIVGPRMQISIVMLSQTGGHGDDWYPSGADVPLLSAIPAARPASSTGPTRSAARSASSTGWAPT
jgi:imidazolonepropionase-like amidohydrolase